MPTATEFLVPSGQDKAGDPTDPQLQPTPVDVQQAGTTINNRTATFDGMRDSISFTDEQNERTPSHSSGAER